VLRPTFTTNSSTPSTFATEFALLPSTSGPAAPNSPAPHCRPNASPCPVPGKHRPLAPSPRTPLLHAAIALSHLSPTAPDSAYRYNSPCGSRLRIARSVSLPWRSPPLQLQV